MELTQEGKQITKIEVQKKDPRRRSLFIDRRFLMGVDYKVVEELDLKIGTTWDDTLEQTIHDAESYRKGLKKAADLLYRSSKTKKQMIRKLIEREFSENVATRIADELEEKGFINDLHYAEQFIETRTNRYGAYRMRQELRLKGVPDQVIDEALNNVEQESEYTRALEMGRKRVGQYASDPKEKAYQKLMSYLSRKGFSYDVVKKVVKELLE